ncbi:MAG: hypothetical protein K0S08_131 [Gammaproteobacteria bacterium]|jgi:hypothetical protein|nr:hypothetical protein [Gammaproteobacteria bacterium]
MKTRHFRRWQRILTYVILAGIFLLLLPFLETQKVSDFWRGVRFILPDAPEVIRNEAQWSAPEAFVVVVSSNSKDVLARLQAAGFPGALNEKAIMVGPYLQSFKSQVDLNKIGQIAGTSVKIMNFEQSKPGA